MKIQATREGKTTNQYMSEMKQKEKQAKERGEELKGPSSEEYEMYISVLNKQRVVSNTLRRLYNVSVGWLPGKKTKVIEDKSSLPGRYWNHNHSNVQVLYLIIFCLQSIMPR